MLSSLDSSIFFVIHVLFYLQKKLSLNSNYSLISFFIIFIIL